MEDVEGIVKHTQPSLSKSDLLRNTLNLFMWLDDF